MSRVILTKANLEYIPAYQLMTQILQEKDGSRRVVKTPLHPEAKAHVEGLKRGAELVPQLFAKLSAPECTWEGHGVSYGFVHGESWCTLLLGAANQGRDAYLSKWREFADIITPRAEGIVPFSQSESFERLFGSGDDFAGMPSFFSVPFDLTPSNIFHAQSGEDVAVDCEWVVDGPLPIDLLRYHTVHATVLNYPQLRDLASEEEVLQVVGVTGELEPLKKAWQHFAAHILFCDETHHPYELRYAKPIEDIQKIRESEEYHRSLVYQLQESVQKLDDLAKAQISWNEHLRNELADRQRMLDTLVNHIEVITQDVKNNNENLAQKENIIRSQEEQLSQMTERIEYIEMKNRGLEAETTACRERESLLTAQVQAMQKTLSWRMTAPIRKIKRGLAALKK